MLAFRLRGFSVSPLAEARLNVIDGVADPGIDTTPTAITA